MIRVILIFSQATIRIDNDLTSLSHRLIVVLDHCWGNLPPYLVDVMFYLSLCPVLHFVSQMPFVSFQ